MNIWAQLNVLRPTKMNPMPFPGFEKLSPNQDAKEDDRANTQTSEQGQSATAHAAAAATSLEPNDVILGRGFRFAWHGGNNAFQALVQSYIPLYDAAKRKTDKSQIVQRIYDKVTTRGRFVKKDETTGLYFSVEEHIAKEKIGQAIRYKKRRSTDSYARPSSSSPMPADTLVAATVQARRRRVIQQDLIDDESMLIALGAPGEVEWPDLSQFEALDQPPLHDDSQSSLLDVLSDLEWEDEPW